MLFLIAQALPSNKVFPLGCLVNLVQVGADACGCMDQAMPGVWD